MRKSSTALFATLLTLLLAMPTAPARAGDLGQDGAHEGMVAVTVTNLTRGETFTPILVVSHRAGIHILELGAPASPELTAVAEAGNTGPLHDSPFASGLAYDSASTAGPVAPGASATVQVKVRGDFDHITLAGMLIPTNDGFVAIDGARVPRHRHTRVLYVPAYDAGTEINDERCANIPGPFCGGEGLSAAGGEGYVHVHGGIHGIGDLDPARFDWRNPVARVRIERVR